MIYQRFVFDFTANHTTRFSSPAG